MSRIPPLEDCQYYTTRTDNGQFVGRVREFPDLHTRPQQTALDAIDAIITATRTKIANLAHAAATIRGQR